MANTTNNNQATSKAKPRVLADKSKEMKQAENQGLLQPLGEDDKVERKTTVDGKVVHSPTTFKFSDKDTKTYYLDTSFDFSACTDEDILLMAMRTVRIRYQDKLRKAGPEKVLTGPQKRAVNVKTDIIDAVRQQGDEDSRLIGLLMKKKGMSREEAEKFAKS